MSWGVTFSLKYRTLLVHSLHCLCIDDFMKVFWNSCTNPEKVWSGIPFYYYCTNCIATAPKVLQQINFLKTSERKECSKIPKISKKSLQNCNFFLNFTDLQSRSSSCPIHPPEFLKLLGEYLLCGGSVVECSGITF